MMGRVESWLLGPSAGMGACVVGKERSVGGVAASLSTETLAAI